MVKKLEGKKKGNMGIEEKGKEYPWNLNELTLLSKCEVGVRKGVKKWEYGGFGGEVEAIPEGKSREEDG